MMPPAFAARVTRLSPFFFTPLRHFDYYSAVADTPAAATPATEDYDVIFICSFRFSPDGYFCALTFYVAMIPLRRCRYRD